MNDALSLAKQNLLSPPGLDLSDSDKLMGRLISQNIDYADLSFQYSRQEGWSLEDGAVKSGSRSTDQGVGVRAVSGEKTGFAYSDEFLQPVLTQAAEKAFRFWYHQRAKLVPTFPRPCVLLVNPRP